MITAASKSTTVVKGDRVKLADSQLNDEVFYLIMILSLNKEKIKRKENSNEKVISFFLDNIKIDMSLFTLFLNMTTYENESHY